MLTSALLQELVCCVAVLGALLLLGVFLRAKVKFFQKLYLPASVIGGFIGLLLGPRVLGANAILKFPAEYITDWSLLPGILIVPIFASVPLGMFMDKPGAKKSSAKKTNGIVSVTKIIIAFALFSVVSYTQALIGFGTNIVFTKLGLADLYRTFGYELSQGFVGGHGTAGSVGVILQSLGVEWWETAQGVTTTTATVGIVGGILFGIAFINIAARKGKTAIVKSASDIPVEMAQGFTTVMEDQPSMGRDTFMNSSIETVTFHFSLMMLACGIGYWLMAKLKATGIKAFTSMPVWIYAMVIMFAINGILKALKLDWAVDSKVKAKISGAMSDIAIVAAIASLNVKAVMAYAVPIAFMCVIGFIATYLLVFVVQGYLYKDDYAFERSIICWGTATGVMITGMMLLKICDPDYETPALTDFSIGFSFLSLVGIITSPILYPLLASGSASQLFIYNLVLVVIFSAMIVTAKVMQKKAAKV